MSSSVIGIWAAADGATPGRTAAAPRAPRVLSALRRDKVVRMFSSIVLPRGWLGVSGRTGYCLSEWTDGTPHVNDTRIRVTRGMRRGRAAVAASAHAPVAASKHDRQRQHGSGRLRGATGHVA